MAKEIIRLSNKDIKNLEVNGKVIGKGTEGTCYKVGNEVYKIYHELYKPLIQNEKAQYDTNGVRIFRRSDLKKYRDRQTILQYKDTEGVTLGVEDGLTRAIDKGTKVIGTRLPTKIITIRDKVRGCVYPYYNHTKSIYKTFKKFYKTRLKICKALIVKVQELIDNNIYTIDLCNKNKINLFNKNDNNVLLSRKNEPIIIDLEGRSTLYTDSDNIQLISKTYYSLILLVLELLTKEVLTSPIEEDNIEEVYSILQEFGLPIETINNILYDSVTKNDITTVLDVAESKIKCK